MHHFKNSQRNMQGKVITDTHKQTKNKTKQKQKQKQNKTKNATLNNLHAMQNRKYSPPPSLKLTLSPMYN